MVIAAIFLLMVALFFIALFFIILNILFIIIWVVRKRTGKTPKKRGIVIPTILLVISLLVELIPIGYIWTVREVNISEAKNIITAESGKIIYWSSDEYADSFEMYGTIYVDITYSADEYYSVSSDTWKLGKPVANIRYKSDEEIFNKFMKFLTAGDFTSTLYPIINENGFELYTIGGGTIYCPENQKDLVLAYYNDFSNYDTENCRYGSFIYKEDIDKNGTNEIIADFDYRNVVLNRSIFENLYQIKYKQKFETINIPEKYINIQNAKKPGTPAYGYNFIILYAYSKDGVMCKEVELSLINEQIYCIKESGEENIKGYRLPYKINEYLKNIIFIDK